MAPEILDPDRYGYVKRARRKLPSKSTDMYALGMTILEARIGSALLLPLPPNIAFSVGGNGPETLRAYQPGCCSHTESPERNSA